MVPAGQRKTAMATRNFLREQQKLKLVNCYAANPRQSHAKSNPIKGFGSLRPPQRCVLLRPDNAATRERD